MFSLIVLAISHYPIMKTQGSNDLASPHEEDASLKCSVLVYATGYLSSSHDEDAAYKCSILITVLAISHHLMMKMQWKTWVFCQCRKTAIGVILSHLFKYIFRAH